MRRHPLLVSPRIATRRPGSDDEHHAERVDIHAAPALGVHTDDVLESAGIDAVARADLRARGVI